MNWEAIGAFAELLAAIGVIVSVAYLSLQIRANNRGQRSLTRHNLHEESVTRMLAFAENDGLADKMMEARTAYEDMTPRDKAQIDSFIRAVFRGFENMFLQHKDGFVESEYFRGVEQAIRLNVRARYFEKWWKENRVLFHRDFQTLVETYMKADP